MLLEGKIQILLEKVENYRQKQMMTGNPLLEEVNEL